MKKIVSAFLAMALIICMVPSAFAASDEAIEAADALHELGLFYGTGVDANKKPIYDLDRTPTRNEAVTMLVRLLGKREEAESGSWSTPFTDVVEWAKPYVGYAYSTGLTNGTSNTTFSGNDAVSTTQYITFVLRALGYESGVDFQWNKAWEFSDKIGLTDGRYNANTSLFTRADLAIISYNAISCKLKDSGQTLLDVVGANKRNFTTFEENYRELEYYKINENVYTDNKLFQYELVLFLYNNEYYAQFDPTLYITGINDVRVEGPLVCLLALTNGLYRIVNTDNPYTNGEIDLDVRPYRTIGMSITENMIYSDIIHFTRSYTYRLNGKSLTTPDEAQENGLVIEGVKFLRGGDGKWYVDVNDFLSYFGFDVGISVQKSDNLTYLVIEK